LKIAILAVKKRSSSGIGHHVVIYVMGDDVGKRAGVVHALRTLIWVGAG